MPDLRTDILVIGAGPAGATAARYAAAKGAKVTVIERRSEVGVPVRCGEMMPSNEEIANMFRNAGDLASLFDLPKDLRLREIIGIKLIDPKGKEKVLDFTGYTTDRDRFDKYLISQAEKEGAELITGCLFKKIENGKAATTLGEIEYKVIIGADGPGSKVAKALGLPKNKDPYPAVTAQAAGDFEPYVKMFFGGIAPGAYGWIIPKKGQANVGIGFSPKFADGTLSEYFERFRAKHDLNVTTRLEGKFVPSEGMLSRVTEGNGMLVGDSAGQVISVNGGGLPLALIAGRVCGEVAADNVTNGRSLTEYQDECVRIFRKPLRTAANNKKLADMLAFGSDRRTEICMGILGVRRMGNLIRCKRIFP
ncbi:MAG: NAD(P)/FAD-dependent oxidoreductase [Candidatus Methanoplasma sp.]|jgi:digeranylgeranylglycerophospholipid reductase|nr:NAD(P)/FAD-dependent oxidoreductase [Candidatus Methanoplasma sp.]